MISHIENYAKKYDRRKKDQSICYHPSFNKNLQKQIHDLEEKLVQYERRKAEALCTVIDALSPPSERIKLIPIYKRLNFIE